MLDVANGLRWAILFSQNRRNLKYAEDQLMIFSKRCVQFDDRKVIESNTPFTCYHQWWPLSFTHRYVQGFREEKSTETEKTRRQWTTANQLIQRPLYATLISYISKNSQRNVCLSFWTLPIAHEQVYIQSAVTLKDIFREHTSIVLCWTLNTYFRDNDDCYLRPTLWVPSSISSLMSLTSPFRPIDIFYFEVIWLNLWGSFRLNSNWVILT